MDWIRRNWPDLLIGIALIAVIAGIVATLLSGGSLLPFGQRQTPVSTSPTSPTVNGSSTLPSSAANGQAATAPAGQVASGGAVIPVVPGSAAALGPAAGAGSTAANTEAASTAPSGGAISTPANTAGVPVGAPSYRISVAAVHNADSAKQLADKLKAAGYPAFVGQQGDLSLVLVGPYGDRGQADATASKLKGDGYDTLIYTYEEAGTTQNAAAPGASTATAASAASSPPATSAATTTATTQPSGSSGTYLQVGAYATLDSAQPQIQRLQQLGYTVNHRQEGDLLKLLIGPFSSDELSAAEARLKTQGIDSFPRH